MRRAAWLAAAMGCVGCGLRTAGPVQHESQSVDRDNAEAVNVRLEMGAGDMKVEGGLGKLMAADFEYNVPEWKPEITYSSTGGKGNLTIRQNDSGSKTGGGQRNEWSVRLNREVPMDVTVHLGAGDAKLNFSTLILRGVNIEMGVGDLDVDLRSTPKDSYNVRIRGGVGDATIDLPSGVGVDARATGGVGGISAPALQQDGSRYYNDALGKSKVTIRLDLTGGVGQIRLVGGA
jgi:hypothetical protein